MTGLRGLVAGVAALALAGPAAAEVRFSNEAVGANYRVTVMSWWEIPFRTVVRQRYDFSCGSAAVATLLSFHYGMPTPERAAFTAMWRLGDREEIRKRGFSLFDMKTYLESRGFRAEGFKLSINDLQGVKRPMIVLVNMNGFKHFVVVKGIRPGRILVGDPMLGLTDYSTDDFAKIWNGVALAIMKAPDSRRPAFNLAGDWGPWSRAPKEDNALRVAIGDVTTDLPPEYQLTPQLLIPVRVGTVD